jgi:hypothetical protein
MRFVVLNLGADARIGGGAWTEIQRIADGDADRKKQKTLLRKTETLHLTLDR